MAVAGRYAVGLEAFTRGEVSWLSDTIKLIACDATYVADFAADATGTPESGGKLVGWRCQSNGQFITDPDGIDGGLASLFSGTPVAYSDAVAGKDLADGYLKASSCLFQDIPLGSTVTQFIIVRQGYFLPAGIWGHLPLALITKDSAGVDINYAGDDGPLAVSFSAVSPYVFQV